MRTWIIGLVCLLSPIALQAQPLSEDDVKALALEAILENPQIIVEALTILEDRRAEEEAAAMAETLAREREFLENDPNAPQMGASDADVVVVEFFDYNCPYCKRAADEIKALLAADENVRVVYREWPVLGEGSVIAARAALAAREQGKYDDMHHALMEMRGRADAATVLSLAQDLGLDVDQLQNDMGSDAVTSHLQASQELAQNLGFTGTPAFVVGDALVPGAIPLSELQRLVADVRAAD